MTNAWDVTVNGYIPINTQRRFAGQAFGDQIGIAQYVYFEGHTEYDSLFQRYEVIGPGTDAEVGYTFVHQRRIRPYVGAYTYFPSHLKTIVGVEGGVEVPLRPWLSLLFRDSYDNLNRNTAMLGLRVRFGGIDKAGEATLHDRLLDEIPRHLGTLHT